MLCIHIVLFCICTVLTCACNYASSHFVLQISDLDLRRRDQTMVVVSVQVREANHIRTIKELLKYFH